MLVDLSLAVTIPASASASSNSTRLRVVISGLPPGTSANVHVRGPRGFAEQLRRSRQFSAVPAGRYRVQVMPVRMARAYRTVPAGSEAFPTQPRLSVRAARGHTTMIRVTYGTIRSARVAVLHVTSRRWR
jgi:hypothetical protein